MARVNKDRREMFETRIRESECFCFHLFNNSSRLLLWSQSRSRLLFKDKMPRERKNAKKQPRLDEEGNPIQPKAKKARRGGGAGGGVGPAGSAGVGRGAPIHNDLAPPPPSSSFGETVFAGNPFDDFPSQPQNGPMAPHPNMGPMGHMVGPHPGMPHPPHPGMHGPPHGPPPVMQGKPGPPITGKIYPRDLPMVSNPANPNAPPIYPCGICHKEVNDNDQAILCESGCNFWYHRGCTGLSELAFTLLNEEIFAEWSCDNCMNTKNIPMVKCKPWAINLCHHYHVLFESPSWWCNLSKCLSRGSALNGNNLLHVSLTILSFSSIRTLFVSCLMTWSIFSSDFKYVNKSCSKSPDVSSSVVNQSRSTGHDTVTINWRINSWDLFLWPVLFKATIIVWTAAISLQSSSRNNWIIQSESPGASLATLLLFSRMANILWM